jgi:ParB family transcriptional regulator, chromosome partitioning protein
VKCSNKTVSTFHNSTDMSKKGGLGRGLGALIPGDSASPPAGLTYLPVDQIVPNPRQPRMEIDPDDLEGLATSIREHGILQPLVVTTDPGGEHYTLIAGERRLRASILAGLETVPAIVRQVSEQERLELALIENIQRTDLHAMETAEAYQQLSDEFGLRHEDIAARVGKSRTAVSNTLRLLQLPAEVKQALRAGQISEGHARTLLSLGTAIAQVTVLKTILEKGLNVRQTEELVRMLGGERLTKRKRRESPSEVKEIEERLRGYLGTRVSLNHGRKGGSLVIYYYSDEELDSLLEHIIREE